MPYSEARGLLPTAAGPCGPLHAAMLTRHPAALNTAIPCESHLLSRRVCRCMQLIGLAKPHPDFVGMLLQMRGQLCRRCRSGTCHWLRPRRMAPRHQPRRRLQMALSKLRQGCLLASGQAMQACCRLAHMKACQMCCKPSTLVVQAGPSSGAQMDADEDVPVATKRKRSARKPARVAPIAFNTADEAGATTGLPQAFTGGDSHQ